MDATLTPEQEGRIAIVGMAGRMPGRDSLEDFWHALLEGRSLLTRLSDEQLDAAGVSAALRSEPGYVPVASGMADSDCFDHGFFGYGHREASIIDPQQRILLELCHSAFEDAGYRPESAGGKVGVYLGTGYCNYLVNNLRGQIDPDDQLSGLQILLGNDKEYAATRVSYKLNLTGPSVAVNSACSTSLVAVHQACRALQNYECDMALGGAAKINIPALTGYLAQEGGISSRDGRCCPYDADGSGPVFGSGAGVVLLKRVEDAVADGDHIYALIRGSAVNNDGAGKVSFSAPSTDGQIDALAEALADAGVSATQIGYVEGHGTSTPLGDPIEVAALTELYQSDGAAPQSCYLGSVKANIGHLEAAAGMAGLFKATYALREGRIPPLVNFRRPNPNIPLQQTPFRINREAVDWPGERQRRIAGVSSFGIGGTNAHLVLEHYREPEAARGEQAAIFPLLLPLSAASDAQLRQLTAAWHKRLPDLSGHLANAAITAAAGRRHHPVRGAWWLGEDSGLTPCDRGEAASTLGLFGSAWQVSSESPGLLQQCLWQRQQSLRARLHERRAALDLDGDVSVGGNTLALLSFAEWLRDAGLPLATIACDNHNLAIAARAQGALRLDQCLDLLLHQAAGNAPAPDNPIPLPIVIDCHSGGHVSRLEYLDADSWPAPSDSPATPPPGLDIRTDGDPRDMEQACWGSLARAYCAGIDIDWPAVYRHLPYRKQPVPTYPFARTRCWIDTDERTPVATRPATSVSRDELLAHIADFAHRPAAEIRPQMQFQRDLQMESMMLAEFNASLKKRFGAAAGVPLSFYFSGGSVGELIEKVQHADAGSGAPAPITDVDKEEAEFIAAARNWETSSQFPALQRLDRHWVHKREERNVLVARIDRLGAQRFIAEITQDSEHPYHYEHAQDHVPGLYLVEAARQAATAIVHRHFDVPLGHKFILNDMNCSFGRFAELNKAVFAGLEFSRCQYTEGVLERAAASVQFIQAGQVIGTLQSQAVIFAASTYDDLRDGQAIIAG
ncbi:beta-ketoacyl synthase N-terminal-like domain-containing protein [Microbulbifer litoralis]|uniref:beta-ketoacyl synthase N-terminal-like domain-containing protein n=1 Tax=Microbulbifer litoralis TaxID=2933965 RepID=UPI00202772F8|nr:beta-ketoacyl synthase N-terminal-like domain-containing protein [Microbulbifer sp. GX H0434]